MRESALALLGRGSCRRMLPERQGSTRGLASLDALLLTPVPKRNDNYWGNMAIFTKVYTLRSTCTYWEREKSRSPRNVQHGNRCALSLPSYWVILPLQYLETLRAEFERILAWSVFHAQKCPLPLPFRPSVARADVRSRSNKWGWRQSAALMTSARADLRGVDPHPLPLPLSLPYLPTLASVLNFPLLLNIHKIFPWYVSG